MVEQESFKFEEQENSDNETLATSVIEKTIQIKSKPCSRRL